MLFYPLPTLQYFLSNFIEISESFLWSIYFHYNFYSIADVYLTGQYDVSKIPDIYDNIKYDLQHNTNTLDIEVAEKLYILSKSLADIVIPQVK